MSTNVNAVELVPSAKVYDFVGTTNYNPNTHTTECNQQVAFKLFSIGRGLGVKLDLNFLASWAIYYSEDDSELISILQQLAPQINWVHNKVYYHRSDYSIDVICTRTDQLVARVGMRTYMGRKLIKTALLAGEYGHNIVSLEAQRAKLTQIEE